MHTCSAFGAVFELQKNLIIPSKCNWNCFRLFISAILFYIHLRGKSIDIYTIYIQGGPHKSGLFLTFKQMNIKSSILKILLNFKNWEAN